MVALVLLNQATHVLCPYKVGRAVAYVSNWRRPSLTATAVRVVSPIVLSSFLLLTAICCTLLIAVTGSPEKLWRRRLSASSAATAPLPCEESVTPSATAKSPTLSSASICPRTGARSLGSNVRRLQ